MHFCVRLTLYSLLIQCYIGQKHIVVSRLGSVDCGHSTPDT